MNFKNKRILITAGPTWVPIDKVRVISNLATGKTGILLAEKLNNLEAQVTLLLGPAESCYLNKKIKLIRFQFFSELKNLILKELKKKKYDIVIHSAAVSDYKPVKTYSYKIKSGIKKLRLDLIPAERIIDAIKKIDKSIFLIGFKFESDAAKELLTRKARNLICSSGSDLVIANTINQNIYRAYIINQDEIYGPIWNRKNLAERLIKVIANY